MASLNLPSTNVSRVLDARSMRTGQTTSDMLRYQGWESLVQQELNEARSRHNDHLLGGEELVSLIEADAAAASAQRTAEKAAI